MTVQFTKHRQVARQEFCKRRRKLVFSRDSGVGEGEFRKNLGQNWWKRRGVEKIKSKSNINDGKKMSHFGKRCNRYKVTNY